MRTRGAERYISVDPDPVPCQASDPKDSDLWYPLTAPRDELDAPTGGNPDGDLTVQAFLDYNCPYCKKAEPELRRFIAADGRVRLVYRDWPILSEASNHGARLALASIRLDRYEDVHRALMAIPGRSTRTAMNDAVRRIGLDVHRLDTEAREQEIAIAGLLARNAGMAATFGLRGVPALLFGSIKVGAGFYLENFALFAARARSAERRTGP